MWLVPVISFFPFFLPRPVLMLTRIVGMRIVRPIHVLPAALGATVFLRPIFGSTILVPAVFEASTTIVILPLRWSLHVSTLVIWSWNFAVHAPIIFPVHPAIIAILTTAIFGTIFRRTIHRSTLSCRNHVASMKICR